MKFKYFIIHIYIIIISFEIYNFQNTSSKNILMLNDENNRKPDNKIKDYSDFIMLTIFNLLYKHLDIINLIEKDDVCNNFIYDFMALDLKLIKELAKKYVRNGFISNSMRGEDECLENNDLYFLFSVNYSYSQIYEDQDIYFSQNQLFIETLTSEQEICLWDHCKMSYKNFGKIVELIKNDLKTIFIFENIRMEDANFKFNGTEFYKIKYNEETLDENYIKYFKYNFYLKIMIVSIIIILVIGTIISYCMEKENDDEKKEIEEEEKKDSDILDILGNNRTESSLIFSSVSSYQNKKLNNFFSAFNFIKNFLLFSHKKEPLSNQNSLIELSTIRLLILFLILLAENTHIIIKYIYKGRFILEFYKNIGFILIKIGTISYEFYKVINGVIFGFKFINYYKKTEDFNFKRIIKFIFKFIPYFIIYLIINYVFQFHSVELASIIHGSVRNDYISRRMSNCYYCQKNYFNSLNPLMITKYNSTDYNIPQYDGCFRTTLFTISEFICYFFMILIMIIFLKIKCKIIEIIFFIINLIMLTLAYILTLETKDLQFFTISRLFGLSASIAMPYLFFPLYFVGFNIGIIYYYNKHQSETFNELGSYNKIKYIPFEYCYKLSIFLKMINGKIKNIILFLCIIFIIGISSFEVFLIKTKNKIYFEFDSFSKFIYAYEGILGGIFFSIFLAIYLSQDEGEFFRIYLSSEFFVFVNKISFIFFNTFLAFLRIFHGINIYEIHLTIINVIRNSITLLLIICLFSIFFSILVFTPIKWIYFFIMNGLNYEDNE